MNVFYELGFIIIIATVFLLIFKILKQPTIPAYIFAGFLLGPSFGAWAFKHGLMPVPGIITNLEMVKGVSEIGLTFLLFIVGLKISVKKLKDVGAVAAVGTVIQFVILFFCGFFLSKAFFPTLPSIYLAIMMSFGSTMVVISILTKKNELDTLHGRIILGILLVQDIIAIIAITILSGISASSGGLTVIFTVMISLLKVIILIGLTILAAMYVFPTIFKFAAKSQEVLLLLSISVAFIFAILTEQIGNILMFCLRICCIPLSQSTCNMINPGFSVAIGAFLGGVALASSPYSVEISSKINPLKDFFASIFFVSLGVELMFDNFITIIPVVIAFLLFLVLIKPTIISMITAVFGYEKRTSFITGISLFQISEFGLIIVTLGYITGQIVDQQFFSLTILLAAITMVLTSYSIEYQNVLYEKIGSHMKFLKILTKKSKNLQYLPNSVENEVVLIGYNRIGFSIFRTLKKMRKNFLVLDYNPEVIKCLIKDKVHCIYGDANNIETLTKLHFHKAKFIISTIPEFETNKLILKKVKESNSKAIIFVTAYNPHNALSLYDLGADYVILPHYLGGDHVSLLLEDITSDLSGMVKHKFNHIQELQERKKNHHVL